MAACKINAVIPRTCQHKNDGLDGGIHEVLQALEDAFGCKLRGDREDFHSLGRIGVSPTRGMNVENSCGMVFELVWAKNPASKQTF